MKRILFTFLLFMVMASFVKASPDFEKNKKYRIVCYTDLGKGSILNNPSLTPQIVYSADLAGVTDNSAAWYMLEVRTGAFAMKNVQTSNRIQFVTSNSNEGLTMVTSDSKSARFTLTLKRKGGKDYYVIASSTTPDQCLERKADGAIVTSTYDATNKNQLFAFIGVEDDVQVKDDAPGSNLNEFVESFTLDGKLLSFDSERGIYYYLVDSRKMNSNITITLNYKLMGAADKFLIEGTEVPNGGTYTFESVSEYKEFGLQINQGDEELVSANMRFKGIPISSGMLYSIMEDFTFNEKLLIYDISNKIYFFSIPENKMGTTMDYTLHYKFKNKQVGNALTVNGKKMSGDGDVTFENITAGVNYPIVIKQGANEADTVYLTFTCLPVVQIFSDNNINSEYSGGYIKVHEPDKSIPAELYNTNIRLRGATAMTKPKKSYAIKLKDENGEKIHKSFFGLREDNNWILDAMAIDPLRMRNRVATDLWNDYSAAPYYKDKEPNLVNGTRGQFVEVFLNNAYIGLYCMTEKIDRKQLKLNKYDDLTTEIKGVLYKATDWTYETFMGHAMDSYNYPMDHPSWYYNGSENWSGFEVKYPDLGDEQKVDWQPLYKAIDFVASESSEKFAINIENEFDVPVWLDYYLLIDLMLATDNHGKNLFIYAYDKNESNKMSVTPWDMDGVFGIRWDSEKYLCAPGQDFISFIQHNEHGEPTLFKRLKETNANGYNQKLKDRYKQLRETYFAPENLNKRFETYKNLFDKAGASIRESRRWSNYSGGFMGGSMPGVNFNYELDYVTNWITTRVAYLDKQYGYMTDTEIENTSLELNIFPSPVIDRLTVSNVSEGDDITIYDAQGRLILQQVADSDMPIIDFSRYERGYYIIKVNEKKGSFLKE